MVKYFKNSQVRNYNTWWYKNTDKSYFKEEKFKNQKSNPNTDEVSYDINYIGWIDSKVEKVNLTGSSTLLRYFFPGETDPIRVLIDFWMFQWVRYEDKANQEVPPEAVLADYLIITHAHMDHCGRVPQLVKAWFKGQILMTEVSKRVMIKMCLDYVNLTKRNIEDAKRYNQNFTKKMTSHLKFVQNYEKYWQKWLSVEERRSIHAFLKDYSWDISFEQTYLESKEMLDIAWISSLWDIKKLNKVVPELLYDEADVLECEKYIKVIDNEDFSEITWDLENIEEEKTEEEISDKNSDLDETSLDDENSDNQESVEEEKTEEEISDENPDLDETSLDEENQDNQESVEEEKVEEKPYDINDLKDHYENTNIVENNPKYREILLEKRKIYSNPTPENLYHLMNSVVKWYDKPIFFHGYSKNDAKKYYESKLEEITIHNNNNKAFRETLFLALERLKNYSWDENKVKLLLEKFSKISCDNDESQKLLEDYNIKTPFDIEKLFDKNELESLTISKEGYHQIKTLIWNIKPETNKYLEKISLENIFNIKNNSKKSLQIPENIYNLLKSNNIYFFNQLQTRVIDFKEEVRLESFKNKFKNEKNIDLDIDLEVKKYYENIYLKYNQTLSNLWVTNLSSLQKVIKNVKNYHDLKPRELSDLTELKRDYLDELSKIVWYLYSKQNIDTWISLDEKKLIIWVYDRFNRYIWENQTATKDLSYYANLISEDDLNILKNNNILNLRDVEIFKATKNRRENIEIFKIFQKYESILSENISNKLPKNRISAELAKYDIKTFDDIINFEKDEEVIESILEKKDLKNKLYNAYRNIFTQNVAKNDEEIQKDIDFLVANNISSREDIKKLKSQDIEFPYNYENIETFCELYKEFDTKSKNIKSLSVKFFEAGHIEWSIQALLSLKWNVYDTFWKYSHTKVINNSLFSWDLWKVWEPNISWTFEIPKDEIHYHQFETTYALRNHPDKSKEFQKLINILNNSLWDVVMPVFSLQRLQEVCVALFNNLMQAKEVRKKYNKLNNDLQENFSEYSRIKNILEATDDKVKDESYNKLVNLKEFLFDNMLWIQSEMQFLENNFLLFDNIYVDSALWNKISEIFLELLPEKYPQLSDEVQIEIFWRVIFKKVEAWMSKKLYEDNQKYSSPALNDYKFKAQLILDTLDALKDEKLSKSRIKTLEIKLNKLRFENQKLVDQIIVDESLSELDQLKYFWKIYYRDEELSLKSTIANSKLKAKKRLILVWGWMWQSWTAKFHFDHILWDKNATILFSWYQWDQTLWKELTTWKKAVIINWEEKSVLCNVYSVWWFSSHGDHRDLLSLVSNVNYATNAVLALVHGDERRFEFSKHINALTNVVKNKVQLLVSELKSRKKII